MGLRYDALFKDQNLYYGIIADGMHTDDSALRLAYSFNPNGLILVTDCISAMGLADGNYRLGNVGIEVKSMCATVKHTKTLAGR